MILKRLISSDEYTVDQYGHLAWVVGFIEGKVPDIEAIRKEGITSAVLVQKFRSGDASQPISYFGEPPSEMTLEEHGVFYELRTTQTVQPGLFLDHQLTRRWIKKNAQDARVLNLFSYTGSLSIAAAMGGACESVSIDLSNHATQWAQKNAALNQLSDKHRFIKGDVFHYLRRYLKQKEQFDLVISDPPSHSRSDQMTFSTQKHLDMLHESCIQVLAPNGTLITSINTEKVGMNILMASVYGSAERLGRVIQKHEVLPLPKGFEEGFRSMKGLRVFFE